MNDLWPNQEFALTETERLSLSGCRHWCVTAPTGAGKSRIMLEEILRAYTKSLRVSLYSPRKLITEQLIGYLQSERIRFGARAAEFDKEFDDEGAYIQICSPQTESSRIRRGKWSDVHPSDLVLVDEAHQQTKGRARELIQRHDEQGATIIEYSASPIGLHQHCEALVIAGTNSEMRRLGALLPATVYDPGCPNLDKIRRDRLTGEFVGSELKAAGYVQSIYASVIEEIRTNNPDMRPGLLSAPGVDESIWFCDRLNKEGIKAVSVDGTNVYRDGTAYESSRAAREDAIEDLKAGRIKYICNRFVFREGVDIPELYHWSCATPIGSFVSLIQATGRPLRAHPSMDHCVISDHGGNFRRHVHSPNDDVDWNRYWELDQQQIAAVKDQEVKQGRKDPGTSCPECGKMYRKLPPVCECGAKIGELYACPECGEKHREWPIGHKCKSCGADMKSIRRKPVIQVSGKLSFVKDSAFHEQPTVNLGERTQKMWDRIFWSAHGTKKKQPSGRTFGQCKAWFIKCHYDEYRCRPPLNLKRMPKNPADWRRRVCDVPFEDLIGYGVKEHALT